jgi:polysaccharide deacetylase 2 family uncharacterized protein YibQ
LILLLAVGISAAVGIYLLPTVFPEQSPSSGKSPIFEIYTSEDFETRLKYLEQAMYSGLLDLGVSVDDVEFQSVSPRESKGLHWEFAELEVRPGRFPSKTDIEKSFDLHLSEIGAAFEITSDDRYPLIVRISLDDLPTHRLLFVRKLKRLVPATRKKLPRVAIIIDDIGYDKQLALDFLSLDAPITLSIFPFSPHGKTIASAARAKGRNVMLHLPMEPQEYPKIDPGKGSLLTSMDADTLIRRLKEDISQLPCIVGVNNHMGSKLTQDSERMNLIFTHLKKKGLFFVDSRTTKLSCARRVASSLKLRFAERQVFIDHLEEESFIRGQLKRLKSVARSRGSAIAIGHPYKLTYRILKQELPNLKKQMKIVPVSRLVRVAN